MTAEFIRCLTVLADIDGKDYVCGTDFVKGSAHAVEACCSLECWLAESEHRQFEERKYWDIEYYGYLSQSEPGEGYIMREDTADPRRNQPDLYRYKGWRAL